MLSQSATRELQMLDERGAALVREIDAARSKRDFLLKFGEDPDAFLSAWVMQQTKDYHDAGTAAGLTEDQRRAEHYRCVSVCSGEPGCHSTPLPLRHPVQRDVGARRRVPLVQRPAAAEADGPPQAARVAPGVIQG